MSLPEVIVTKIAEAGGKLKVRSALNPILWLCAIITIPSLALIIIMAQPPSWIVFLAFSPVITAIIGFLFLLFFDRDKLQSESYQIKKRQLEMIEEKGMKAIDPGIVEAIAEPDAPLLEGEVEDIESEEK